MKQAVHPVWFNDAKVVCACGESFVTGSTQELIKIEICSKCHPLFTGKQKFVDTLGQVDRFEQKKKKAAEKGAIRAQILSQRAAKVTEEKKEKPSLKDLLMQARKQAVH